MLCAYKSEFLLILAFCAFERISSYPQRNLRQHVATSGATLQLAVNQTSVTTRQLARLTESYLPAVMQAIAYHIELLQYEPVYSTTIEPPFSGPSTTPPTLPNFPASSSPHPPVQQPVTWWSPPSTTTIKPTTWWSPPSTTTQKPTTTSWWNPPSTTNQRTTTTAWWNTQSTTTKKPSYSWSYPTTTTLKPTTTSWWSPPSSTTQKPLYSWSYPTQSSSTSSWFTTQKPTTTSWWSTTTKKPSYSWSYPTQSPPTTSKPWNPSSVALDWTSSTFTTTTQRPSTTTPSWWHQESTPFHKPGYFAPDRNDFTNRPISNNINNNLPLQPQIGDLSFLSISNFPYFSHFVQPNSKSFVRKPEYEYLHQYPAELLQDIEKESDERPKGSDQEVINEFRRVYDDFFARVRVFSPITGKKRVPPTRPYVLFLIFYDLCKREAKRLNLQEFTGYSESMLVKLHETSKYSAERQLFTLLDELYQQKSIVATDFVTRLTEIMIDLANPNSVTSKALHILPPLKFEL